MGAKSDLIPGVGGGGAPLLTPRVLAEAVAFVGTGIVSTLAAQLLLYAGVSSATGLLPLANYAGMCFAASANAQYAACTGDASQQQQQQQQPASSQSASLSSSASSSAASETPPASPAHHALGPASAEAVLDLGFAAQTAASSSALPPPESLSPHQEQQPPLPPPPLPVAAVTLAAFVPLAVALDLFGYWLHLKGLELAGSSLFQVLYASVVVWAALGTRLLRGPVHGAFNRAQITGIAIVLAGLAFSALAEGGGGPAAAQWLPPTLWKRSARKSAVFGTCGPRHRSTKGPQRKTVMAAPAGRRASTSSLYLLSRKSSACGAGARKERRE